MIIAKQDQNKVLFFQWLKHAHPALYKAGVEPLFNQGSLSGIWDSITSGISSVLKTASSVLPSLAQTYVQTKEQKNLLNLNLQRAEQGLAPIESLTAPPATTAPAGTVPQQQYYPATAPQGFTDFLSSIPDWVKYGALAGAAFLLIKARRRRR